MLILDFRVSLALVVVLVPGCRLSVDSCCLLIFCAAVVAQFLLLSVPSSVYRCGKQYTFSQTTFSLLALENTDVNKNYSTV